MRRSYEEGSAFKRPAVTKDAPKEEETPPTSNERAKYAWSDTPTFRDQMEKHPDTTRVGSKKSAVFNLAGEDGVKNWNDLLSKTIPPEAPQVIILDQERNFSESAGGYVIYVEYYTVEYAQLTSAKL